MEIRAILVKKGVIDDTQRLIELEKARKEAEEKQIREKEALEVERKYVLRVLLLLF